MKVSNDECGSFLEKPSEIIDYTRVWQTVLKSLEELLGQDAARAFCFHISGRTGMTIDILVMEDPARFRETAITLVDGSVDKVLDKIGSRLLQEFEIEYNQQSFVEAVAELRKRA